MFAIFILTVRLIFCSFYQQPLRTPLAPFKVNEKDHLYLNASIGISVFPQDGEGCTTLLENADRAMYEAKKEKLKSAYRFYHSEYRNAR